MEQTLIIREAQMQALRDAARDRFARAAAAELRRADPAAVAAFDDAALLALVRRGMERARAYGLVEAEPVRAFLSLLVSVGPAFDRHPSIRAILTDPALRPGQRITRLLSAITTREWADAAALKPLAEAEPRKRDAPAG
ncbi:MAG TPA: hypothetical protein VF541_04975 [Longimicrobium sp.]|jgi:hypothetical protein